MAYAFPSLVAPETSITAAAGRRVAFGSVQLVREQPQPAGHGPAPAVCARRPSEARLGRRHRPENARVCVPRAARVPLVIRSPHFNLKRVPSLHPPTVSLRARCCHHESWPRQRVAQGAHMWYRDSRAPPSLRGTASVVNPKWQRRPAAFGAHGTTTAAAPSSQGTRPSTLASVAARTSATAWNARRGDVMRRTRTRLPCGSAMRCCRCCPAAAERRGAQITSTVQPRRCCCGRGMSKAPAPSRTTTTRCGMRHGYGPNPYP